MKSKIAVGAGIVLGAALLGAGPASAAHTHVRVLANGDCVVLAADGAESGLDLSDTGVFEHNPNVDVAAAPGRNHPLHVLVHKGAAGDVQRIEVKGSAGDPCWGPAATGQYLNDRP